MLFAARLQSILTDVSSNQFWRNFPVKGIASWLVDIGGQILQGMGLKSLNSSQQIRNRTPAGAREWDRLAVEGQAAAWIWSLYIPKIKNRRHFPPSISSHSFQVKDFRTAAEIWPPDFDAETLPRYKNKIWFKQQPVISCWRPAVSPISINGSYTA